MARKTCIVTLTDIHGVRHSVEVAADSLFEAAARGLSLLRNSPFVPALKTSRYLEVIVREPSTRHRVEIGRLEAWLSAHVGRRDYMARDRIRKLIWAPPTPRKKPH